MTSNWLRSGLLVLVVGAALHAQGREELLKTVNSTSGWSATGKPRTYSESNIKTFAPELAADLRIYGLNGVTVQSWSGPLGPVKATMFQLLDSGGAYGFFTIRRRAENTPSPETSAGVESFRSGNRLYLWQGNYVIRLEGESGAVNALAKVLSENIVGRSPRPSISNHLPAANLIAGSETFLLDAAELPKIDGVNSSELGFDSSALAATADYRVNGKSARLLLMLYPTQQLARKYTDQLNAATPHLAESRKRVGPMLAIVSGTSDAAVIQSILDQVHYQSKVTWEEPKPGLGLGPIIVTAFTFIGILLVLSVVAGIGLGGVQFLRNAWFTNRGRNLPRDAEIIQLKLDQGLIRKELRE